MTTINICMFLTKAGKQNHKIVKTLSEVFSDLPNTLVDLIVNR